MENEYTYKIKDERHNVKGGDEAKLDKSSRKEWQMRFSQLLFPLGQSSLSLRRISRIHNPEP